MKMRYILALGLLVGCFLCAAKIDGGTHRAEMHTHKTEGIYDAEAETVTTSDGNVWGYKGTADSGHVTVWFDDMGTESIIDDTIIACR